MAFTLAAADDDDDDDDDDEEEEGALKFSSMSSKNRHLKINAVV